MRSGVTRREFLATTGGTGVGLAMSAALHAAVGAEPPELIVYHGKIVTVDPRFRIAEAMAVSGERIVAIGSNNDVLRLAAPNTKRIDLAGRTVLPGLIDSHLHPTSGAMTEFDHPVPTMETIDDVLEHVRARAATLPEGQWIIISQVFITRLREQRFPTWQELDAAAPKHPVVFRTGPDASINSLAMKLSGIDRDFKVTDGQTGFIQRDPASGEPTGIVRNGGRFIKSKSSDKAATPQDQTDRLAAMLAAYNAVGITSITDRGVSDGSMKTYEQLRNSGRLSCRVFLTYTINPHAPLEKIEAQIQAAACHPLHKYNNQLWLRGTKVWLDGGMLTGTAYLRKPWGVSSIYSITDPDYRGLLFIQPERLEQVYRLSMEHGFQPAAHSVGDGAVHAILDACDRINRELPVRPSRPCICHSNFMSLEAVEAMQRLGVVADMQPVWLYLDGATLHKQFGDQRLAYFQPYKTILDHGVTVGGGSDHMQKVGRRRSINSYDPFLGIWTALVRQPRWTDAPLHTEQCITREQAIRLYTINCAYLTFEEKEKGSLEPGKLADFIVLDKDILTCPIDDVKDIEVEQTYLGGRCVYQRQPGASTLS